MKIYAISDMHGQLDGLDPVGADLVIVAGDFAIMKGWGVWHMNDQVKWINRKFAAWCAKYPETDFCVIPGNHDLFAQHPEVPTKPEFPPNVHYICNSVAEVRGLRIAGCSWIPRISGRWAFETADGAELARRFGSLPEGLDILITHTPPFVEGSCIDLSLQTMSPHFGSPELTEAIRRVKPRYLFCGHIHTGDHTPLAITHDDGSSTVCYNVSRLDENYEIAYEPRVVEI